MKGGRQRISGGVWLAALALLALVLALWLRNELGGTAEPEEQSSVPEADASRTSGSDAGTESDGLAADSRTTLAEEARSDEPEAVAEQDPGVELLAIVGAHRKRVAPVELWWWQPKESENWQELHSVERWMRSGELDARLAEQAQQLAPDANGIFHAPAPLAVGCVIARAEGLLGWSLVLRSSPDPTYIELEADETLLVRVLDAAGAPAPLARVALRQRWPADAGEPDIADLAMVTTDADGLASFPHFRGLMQAAWDFDAQHVLTVAEPFAQPVEVEFDPTRPPGETIELRLPACGSVVLEVEGDARGAQFSLALASASGVAEELELQGGEFLRPASDGQASFPYVGLGLLVTPKSVVDGRVTLHEGSTALGPSRPGEERRLRIDVQAEPKPERRMVGKLVGPALRTSGATRVDIELRGQDLSGAAWTQNLRVLVLPDGRFLIPLLREAAGPTQLEFRVLGPRDELVGETELTAIAHAGIAELDLGEIFLDARSMLVAGRVVDRNGKRVVGARVSALGTRTSAASVQARGWQRAQELQTYSGPDGAFELRGDPEWTALGVSAWSSDGASEFRVVEPGTRDVVLTLAADGALAGSVSLAGGLAREYLTVTVRPEGESSTPRGATPMRRSELDAEGAFVVRGLAPGSYTVSVYASGAPVEVAQVQGVLVEAGSLARDPRLDPLEIGNWSVLRVLDSEGEPASRAAAHVFDRRARRWITHAMPSGKLMLERGTPPLWFAAPGHLLARFDPASGTDSVQLERAPRVQIQVAPELLEALDGLKLELVLQSTELPPAIARGRADHIAIDRALSEPFALHHSTPLATSLVLTGARPIELPHQLLGSVRAASNGSPQPLELRFTPADLAGALEQAR